MTPLISIIIPNYNREDLIGETLASIISQSYTNWECLVIDDGSTDASFKVVEGYVAKDSRIKQYKRPDNYKKGACACRNYGFELAQGSYINWFDSDDLMVSTKIEDQLKAILVSNADLAVCQTAFFEKEPRQHLKYWNHHFKKKNDPLTDYITFRLAWSTNAPLWKKSFLEGRKMFDVSLKSSQDWEFHVRMLTLKPSMNVLDKVLVKNRIHQQRIGSKVDNSRFLNRLFTRELTFDLLKNKDLLNNEIKEYYTSYFVNQLKYISKDTDLVNRLIPRIKQGVGSLKWYIVIFPKIKIYASIFRITDKKYWTFRTIIEQTINGNRT